MFVDCCPTKEVPLVAGNLQDLYDRRPIGLQRLEEVNKPEDSALNLFKRVRADLPENNPDLFRKVGRRLEKIINSLENFTVNLDGTVKDEEKADMFGDAIEAMVQLGTRNGIILPTGDELLRRLLLVDDNTFRNISIQETGEEGDNSLAFTLPNRLCFINTESKELGSRKSTKRKRMVTIGVHELWHSVDYREQWLDYPNQDYPDADPLRQSGLQISSCPAHPNDKIRGLWRLDEGFASFRTRETFLLLGDRKPFKDQYTDELKIVELLISKVGTEPLFAAAEKKEGLSTLDELLVARDKQHSIEAIATAMTDDAKLRLVESWTHTPLSPYPNTTRLILSQ